MLTAVMTAVNDEGGVINVAKDVDGTEDTIPKTMQKYQSRQEPWMLVVDDNCEWGSGWGCVVALLCSRLVFVTN